MRVYEIAKEVGIPNKDLLAKIRALGLEVNNHMSSLDADAYARIKRSLEKERTSTSTTTTETKVQSVGGGAAVLRRRSSGSEGGPPGPSERPSQGAPAPHASAPAPVVRRRVADDTTHATPQTAPHAPAPQPIVRHRVERPEAERPEAHARPAPERHAH